MMNGRAARWTMGFLAVSTALLSGCEPGTREDLEAVRLARAAFPSLAPALGSARDLRSAPGALRVRLPEREGGAVELATRGHTFSVRRLGSGTGARLRRVGEALAFGPNSLWLPAGAADESKDGWLAMRVDEYAVVPAETRVFTARYALELPAGDWRGRQTEQALELGLAGEPPVLRVHQPVARDEAGATRVGSLALEGAAAAGSDGWRPLGRRVTLAVAVDLRGLEGAVVVDPGWSSAASPGTPRQGHTATLLYNGKVLLAGGGDGASSTATSASELYDPATDTFSATGAMTSARRVHTATMLPSGKVLLAGGLDASSQPLSSAELYDPVAGTFAAVGSMASPRIAHTATLLGNGKVLVVGSAGGGSLPTAGWLASAELFDPATGTFSPAGAMSTARGFQTATVLPNGKVLVAGGYSLSGTAYLASAELYDPVSGTFAPTGSMGTARGYHAATLLPSGKVLISAGNGQLTWRTAELYDPATGLFNPTGTAASVRMFHSATLLPSGQVLVSGGGDASAELYDPGTGSWTGAGTLSAARSSHTATLLASGKVLVVGGTGAVGTAGSAELFTPDAGSWSATGPLLAARSSPAAARLASGKVLVLGGQAGGQAGLSSAELYHPDAGTFSATGALAQGRAYASATLLQSGKVLVAGGYSGGQLGSAELFDAAAGTFSPTGALAAARYLHTATLLPSGKVLVAGGWSSTTSTVLSSAELYDPQAGTFSATGALGFPRYLHTATLLPSGKVLVAGGMSVSASSTVTPTAELYDPQTGSFTATGAMASARYDFTATLLPTGKVLAVGGVGAGYLRSAELYDPATGTWSAAASLAAPRHHHTAAVLPSGQVLLAGGWTPTGAGGMPDWAPAAYLYDPASGQWAPTAPLPTGRANHAAAVLSGGQVLLAGGSVPGATTTSAVLYDEASAPSAWRPTIFGPARADAGATVSVTGSGFRGISSASSGNRADSATNFPLVGLQALGGGPLTWLPVTRFTDSAADVRLPSWSPGPYRLRVVVNALWADTALELAGAPVDRPPAVSNQFGGTLEDIAVYIALTGSDPDGDAVSFGIVSGPAHGTLSGTPPNLFYTPAPNYAGPDLFTFKATARGVDSTTGTIQIQVYPVNDAPLAQDQAVSTTAPDAVAFTLLGSDVDGDALTWRVLAGPDGATLTGVPPALVYRPRPGFSGVDALQFVVSDGQVESAPAVVTFTVLDGTGPGWQDGGKSNGGAADGGAASRAPQAGCTCGSFAGLPGGAWLVLLLWGRRRRPAGRGAEPCAGTGSALRK